MRRLLIALTALALPVAALAQTRELSTTGIPLDRVVAIVNDGVVLQSQLDNQTRLIMGRLREQGTQLPPADVIRQQVLERLVLQEIQVQRAQRLGVQVSDEMLNEALRDVAKRNSIPFEQLPAVLATQGIDYAVYREEMRREITLSLLRQRDVIPRIHVWTRELDAALERQAGEVGEDGEADPAPPQRRTDVDVLEPDAGPALEGREGGEVDRVAGDVAVGFEDQRLGRAAVLVDALEQLGVADHPVRELLVGGELFDQREQQRCIASLCRADREAVAHRIRAA